MVIRTLTEVLVVGLHAGSAAFPGWPSDEHSTPRGLSFLICPMGRVVPNLHPHRTSGAKGKAWARVLQLFSLAPLLRAQGRRLFWEAG